MIDLSTLTEDSRLIQDIELDSIGVIDLFYEIEEETGTQISVIELSRHFNPSYLLVYRDFTVGDIASYLGELGKASS